MAQVTLQKVKKVYANGYEAVKSIDLDIHDGEFMVLVGPSGCAKSTTLRMIAGLEDITSGDLFIGERKVNELPPGKRNVAMVFQDYALYPHMTVYENMAYGLRIRKLSKHEIHQRVTNAAQMLGLTEHLAQKPKALSGGQRQRVAVGRTLVREPDVFLFDEPLSNLDAKLRVQMRSDLKRLQRRVGVTTIYVTHDQIEAITLGDRIAVLSDGVLQQLGPPQDVYDRPANVFVAGFIGSPPMNLFRGHVSHGRVAVGHVELPEVTAADGDVLVGIRPEGLRPVGTAHDGPVVDVDVEVIEPLGEDVLVHGSIEARAAETRVDGEDTTLLPGADDRGRAAIVLRLRPEERPPAGARLRRSHSPAAVRLFAAPGGSADPQTGREAGPS